MSSDNTLKALYNPQVVEALSCPFRAPLVAVPIPGAAPQAIIVQAFQANNCHEDSCSASFSFAPRKIALAVVVEMRT